MKIAVTDTIGMNRIEVVKQMIISEQLYKKMKEDLLHILEWTMDSNKQVALDAINDTADNLLKEMKEEENIKECDCGKKECRYCGPLQCCDLLK